MKSGFVGGIRAPNGFTFRLLQSLSDTAMCKRESWNNNACSSSVRGIKRDPILQTHLGVRNRTQMNYSAARYLTKGFLHRTKVGAVCLTEYRALWKRQMFGQRYDIDCSDGMTLREYVLRCMGSDEARGAGNCDVNHYSR